jgi:hypothetical protein
MTRRTKTTKKPPEQRDVGIPGDKYRVELRGQHLYYVVDADTRGIMGGPYSNRDQAQRRADQLNLTVWKAR